MNDRSRPLSSPSLPPRIVVAGAAHIDRSGWLAASSALGCSNPGQFDERPGGTALNIARNLAALQAPVELISLLGRDAAGDWLQRAIETSGITAHVTGLSDLKAQTGTYTSIIEPNGELLVAVADMAIYEQFAADAVQHAVGDLQPTDWLCVDTNLPPEEVARLLNGSAASKAGVTVSKAKARRLLAYASQLDVVFTNISEAHALCGFDGDETKPMTEIAAGLADRDIRTVVISNGGQPVTLINGGQIMTIEIEPVDQVADVTGAGDALVGAALFALTQGQDLPDAVAYGIQAARTTIRIRGAVCQDLSAQIGSPS